MRLPSITLVVHHSTKENFAPWIEIVNRALDHRDFASPEARLQSRPPWKVLSRPRLCVIPSKPTGGTGLRWTGTAGACSLRRRSGPQATPALSMSSIVKRLSVRLTQ